MKIDALFCDDIRPEASGKLILVGVYPNDIVSGGSPAKFPLALWVRITGLPTSSKKFELKIKTDDDATDLDFSGDLYSPDNGDSIVMAFGGFPVSVKSGTTLRALLSLDDGESMEIASIPVKIAAPPPNFSFSQR